MNYVHQTLHRKGVRIADKYVIQVWNGNTHLETIGTPGHPVWGKPMGRGQALRMIAELRRTKQYPDEQQLIPVKQ